MRPAMRKPSKKISYPYHLFAAKAVHLAVDVLLHLVPENIKF